MIEHHVTVSFLAPPSLLRKIERIRRRRMKEAGGHISRSVLLREALSKLAESDGYWDGGQSSKKSTQARA